MTVSTEIERSFYELTLALGPRSSRVIVTRQRWQMVFLSLARLDLPDAGKLRKRHSKISIWSKPPLIAFSYSPLFVSRPLLRRLQVSSRAYRVRAYIFRGKYKFSNEIRDSGLAWAAARRWKRGVYNNCAQRDSIQWIIECEKSCGKVLIPFVSIERVPMCAEYGQYISYMYRQGVIFVLIYRRKFRITIHLNIFLNWNNCAFAYHRVFNAINMHIYNNINYSNKIITNTCILLDKNIILRYKEDKRKIKYKKYAILFSHREKKFDPNGILYSK